MNILRKFFGVLLYFAVLSLVACSASGGDTGGGSADGGAATSDTMDLSGIYDCFDGCDSEVCEFGSGITVTQSGQDVTFTGLTGVLEGVVGDAGTFAVENAEAYCEGQCTTSGTLTNCSIDCSTFDGVDCQTALFRKR